MRPTYLPDVGRDRAQLTPLKNLGATAPRFLSSVVWARSRPKLDTLESWARPGLNFTSQDLGALLYLELSFSNVDLGARAPEVLTQEFGARAPDSEHGNDVLAVLLPYNAC